MSKPISTGPSFKRLYHYTAGEYLRGIAEHGLTIGDVPLDDDHGEIGVWLTSSLSARGHGLEGSALNKWQFRLAVDVPNNLCLERWNGWSRKNVEEKVIDRLESAAASAGNRSADSWYIYFGWIKPERISEVVDMTTGAIVSDWQSYWAEAQSLPGISYSRRHNWQKSMLAGVKRARRELMANARRARSQQQYLQIRYPRR